MKTQRGNALFLILIAVALFAALSYAITRSGAGGSGGASKEQAVLLGGQIMQMATAISTGVQRMELSGTPLGSIVAGSGGPLNCVGRGSLNSCSNFCTTGTTCLFAPDGGGVSVPAPPRAAYRDTPPSWSTVAYFQPNGFTGAEICGLSGTTALCDMRVRGVGTDAGIEDMLRMYPLTQAVCQAINNSLGISGIPQDLIYLDVAALIGQESACIDWNATGTYMYYQVLHAN